MHSPSKDAVLHSVFYYIACVVKSQPQVDLVTCELRHVIKKQDFMTAGVVKWSQTFSRGLSGLRLGCTPPPRVTSCCHTGQSPSCCYAFCWGRVDLHNTRPENPCTRYIARLAHTHECCDGRMAYHTLMAELEALEKAAAALAPSYKQKFGTGDELFYASMRLALQSIKPAGDCTPSLRESNPEPANDLRDRVTRHPPPEPFCPHLHPNTSHQNTFSSAHTASSYSTSASHPSRGGHKPHPFRQGMITRGSCAVHGDGDGEAPAQLHGEAPDAEPGSPLPGSFGPSHRFRQGMLITGMGKSMNDVHARRDVVELEREEPAAFNRSAHDLRPALRRTSVCTVSTSPGSHRRTSFSTSTSSARSGSHVSFDASVDFSNENARDKRCFRSSKSQTRCVDALRP